jgi:hypothetical protein
MSWDVLLHPLAGYVLTAGGLAACGYLFLAAKREALRTARRCAEQQEALEAEIRRLAESVHSLAGRVEEIASLAEAQAPPPAGGGLNLSTRTRALRMHRRGDPPERIAAALSLPQQEVELLLKVEALAAGRD